MNIKSPCLCNRLSVVSEFVRQGAVVADIGTDHALLPIYLLRTGKAKKAIAADIAEGPLAAAAKNISAYGLSDKITTVLSDGLDKIAPFSPTDITICGMGGETVIDIISKAPWVKDPDIRLICQAQSFLPVLREYLLKEGFYIADEAICRDRGKFYVCIVAEYGQSEDDYSETELQIGRRNIEKSEPILKDYASHLINILKKKSDGLKTAGIDASDTDKLTEALKKYL